MYLINEAALNNWMSSSYTDSTENKTRANCIFQDTEINGGSETRSELNTATLSEFVR